MILKRWINYLRNFVSHREDHPELARDDQEHVMSPEEQLDETIDNSFPASDPPGHYSKSAEDKLLHQSR